MADPNESQDHVGRGSATAGAWMDMHLSGLITPLGVRIESVLTKLMSLIVGGFFNQIAVLLVVIIAPVLLLEFVLRTVRF